MLGADLPVTAGAGPGTRKADGRGGDRSNATRIPVLDLDRLRVWLTEGDVEMGRIAVVSVEIDNLASVNERLGARAGVELVESITQRLRTLTRPRDVVAHVNQDRFVLVCRDVPDRAAAEALSQRVALGVVAPVGARRRSGRSEREHRRRARLPATRRARRACCGARSRRGSRRGSSAVAGSRSHRRSRRHNCRKASSRRRSRATSSACTTSRSSAARPVGSPGSRRSCAGSTRSGACSPRRSSWATPSAPARSWPSGTGRSKQGCRQLAEWHAGDGATLKLNVNVAARQFAEPTLPAQVKRIINESGVAPGDVWLEITEETLLQDRDTADLALRQLHEVGVRLVIDDFGSGASSLVSLKHFPIDAIKIDQPFVADLGRDRDGDAICSAIVALAHSLGLCAIAEGVETLEQFAALRSLGCELAQGHVFGPARPATDFGATPAATLGVVRGADRVTRRLSCRAAGEYAPARAMVRHRVALLVLVSLVGLTLVPAATAHAAAAAPAAADAPVVAASPLAWSRCGALECATLPVPLDDAAPDAGTIDLAVGASAGRQRGAPDRVVGREPGRAGSARDRFSPCDLRVVSPRAARTVRPRRLRSPRRREEQSDRVCRQPRPAVRRVVLAADRRRARRARVRGPRGCRRVRGAQRRSAGARVDPSDGTRPRPSARRAR